MNYKVSVIVPVYGVEKMVERCARSILTQTIDNLEIIFVDDATPDDSMNIIKRVAQEYPSRNIRFLTHTKNAGLPSARNTGLKIATGKYIFHCDSDDHIEPEMLEVLYRQAEENNADIVWCDWILETEKGSRYMKQPCYTSSEDALIGMLNGIMKYNVWNKLVKRDLYVKSYIQFPDGYGMGEDMTMIKLFCHAQNVCYVNQAFYHYANTNQTSFSNIYSDQHLKEVVHNTNALIDYIHKVFGNKYNRNIEFFKLEIKFPFLISNNKFQHDRWKSIFPESNISVYSNPDISFRRKLLQIMAANNQWWYVNLYHIVIFKLLPLIKYL